MKTRSGVSFFPDALIVPDNLGSKVLVAGSASDVQAITQFIRDTDVPRKRLHLAIDIDSPTDKLNERFSADMSSGDTWDNSVSDLDAHIVTTVRVNADNSASIKICLLIQKHEMTSIFRLNPKKSVTLDFGNQIKADGSPVGYDTYEVGQKIKVTYEPLR